MTNVLNSMTTLARTCGVRVALCSLILSGCVVVDPYAVEPGSGESLDERSSQTADGPISDAEYLKLLSEGDEAYQRDELDTAQVKYALAVSERADDLDARHKLGIVHYRKGSFDTAREILQGVVEADQTRIAALETLGSIALHDRAFDEAELHFDRVLAQKARRWRSLNGLGIVRDLQGRHDEAQVLFDKALAVSPRNARVLNNLGYSHYLAGNDRLAETYFQQAARRDASYAKAWSNLGLVYVRQRRYDDARAAFGKLVEPHEAANTLGYLGMLQGDERLAERELNEAIRSAPSYYPLANENLALLDRRVVARSTDTPPLPVDTTGHADAVENPPMTVAATHPVADPQMAVIVKAVPDEVLLGAALPDTRDRPKPKPTVSRSLRRPSASRAATGSATAAPRTLPVTSQLKFLGYEVDRRRNGPRTEQSIRDFQVAHGLTVDGRVGKRTRASINVEAVRRAQIFLTSLGYSPGNTEGELTLGTRAAVRSFERDQSLSVDGELDSEVLERLYTRVMSNNDA